ENDPGLWAQALLNLANRLQQRGKAEAAQVLFQALAVEGPVPGDLRPMVELARRRFAAAQGGGNISDRVEGLARDFWHEASDPYSLLGFAVGGTVFRLGHAALSSRLLAASPGLLTRGLTAKLFAQVGAFGAELPAFVISSKAARHWLQDRQDWHPNVLGKELLAAGLTLSFLKGAGGLSRALGTHPAVQQLSLYGGILLAQGVEGRWGLRPEVAGAAAYLQALATLLQFNVAGRMSDGILGESYRKAMQGIEWRRQIVDRGWMAEKSWQQFPQYVMSTGSNGGKGPGDGKGPKVVELFPMANEGTKGSAPKPIDTGADLERARTVAYETGECYAKILESLASFRAAAELRANMMERDRGEPGTILELTELMADWRRVFDENLSQGQWGAAELRRLHFLTASRPTLHERTMALRHKIDQLGDASSGLAMGFEVIERNLAQGNIGETLRLLATWSSLFPQKTWPQLVFPIDFVSDPTQGLKVARLSGMMYGALAKEVLRGLHRFSPGLGLDPRSPRAKDPDEAPRLLTALLKAGGRDYAEILLDHAAPPTSHLPSLPGETLRFHGSHDQPFRSWFSLHLPALMLQHRGRSVEVLEKIKAIEFFMSPESREANRWILDWLQKALERGGHPREWSLEIAREDWTRLVLAQVNETGPLSVFAHSIDAFIRYPTEPVRAMRMAMAAPDTIREDAVALTGALTGAYLGRSAFGAALLLPEVNRAFPQRKVNYKLQDSWMLDTGHMAFERSARLALDHGAALRPPVRSIDRIQGAVENSAWAAFSRGLGERQSRIESLFLEAMNTTAEFVAAPPAAIQGQHHVQFYDFLQREEYKIDKLLRELRKYVEGARGRLVELGLSEDSASWKNIEAALERYNEASSACRALLGLARLNWDSIGHFGSPEQAKAAFREQIQRFDQAFGVVDRASPEIRGDWVRRFAETMAGEAKRGKIVNLWRQWSREKQLEPSASEKRSLEYTLESCPSYLLSDLAYWAEHEPMMAKAWLSRLGFLPRDSALWRDSEVRDLLEGRRPRLNFDHLVAEDAILHNYAFYGGRLFPKTYRALGPSERRQMRAVIESLPPILLESLLQPDLRPDTFLLLTNELGLSRLGVPPDVD
ncbi:MAG TPA: hypothetical protein VFW62_08280, partial [bacterium]|nr:hypothetical protein [bacterium]